MAKTRRIGAFFRCDSTDMNKKIVGAKFSKDKRNHIITYYVSRKAIDKTLEEANIVKKITCIRTKIPCIKKERTCEIVCYMR